MAVQGITRRLTLDRDQLNNIAPDKPLRHKELLSRSLEVHPTFTAVELAFNELVKQYQRAEKIVYLLPGQQQELIDAWNQYCQKMLDFIGYLKEQVAKDGAETVFIIGQAYLKLLVSPYQTLTGKEFAYLLNNPDIQIKQLIYTPNNTEILQFHHLLISLEKYYQKHITLVDQLKKFNIIADKLSKYNLWECQQDQTKTVLAQYQNDCQQFIAVLQQLQTTRASLDLQIKKFDKQFSMFLLGPIFKFFWGKQRQICKLVMDTVDDRVNMVAEEVAERMNAQGATYLSHLANVKNADSIDSMAANKCYCVYDNLRLLAHAHPHEGIQQAQTQFKQICQTFIDASLKSNKMHNKALGMYLGACLQDQLKLKNYRQTITQIKQSNEEKASRLLADLNKKQTEVETNQALSRQNSATDARRFQQNRFALALFKAWQIDGDFTAIKDLSLASPESDKLAETLTPLAAIDQLTELPIEILVTIVRYGPRNLQKLIAERIEGYLSAYQNYGHSIPHLHSQRILAIVFHAGTIVQIDILKGIFLSWQAQNLYAKAHDREELANAVETAINVKKFAQQNQNPELVKHCDTLLRELSQLLIDVLLGEKTLPAENDSLQHRLNILDVCSTPSFQFNANALILSYYSGDQCWRDNAPHFATRPWRLIKPLAELMSQFAEPLSHGHRALICEFTEHATKAQKNFAKLANTATHDSIAMLTDCERYYPEATRVLAEYKKPAAFPQGQFAVAGYYFWQAFAKHWQQLNFLPLDNADEFNTTLQQCLLLLNELVKCHQQAKEQFVYPQSLQVIEFLQTCQQIYDETATGKDQYNSTFALKKRLLESITHNPLAYPDLMQQVVWEKKQKRFAQASDEQAIMTSAITTLTDFSQWLDHLDFDNPDWDGDCYQDDELIESFWGGIIDQHKGAYRNVALNITDKLCRCARRYLEAYQTKPTALCWSVAHSKNLQFILNLLSLMHQRPQEVSDEQANREVAQIYELSQSVSQLGMLRGIFVEIYPEHWRANWRCYAELDQMDAKAEVLAKRSPMTNNERGKVKKLVEQLQYLIDGKDNHLLQNLLLWRRLNPQDLVALLKQVKGIADERRQWSNAYIGELAAIQSRRQSPAAIGLEHQRRHSEPTIVANQIETQFNGLIEKIARAASEDYKKLIAALNNKKPIESMSFLLFIHRLSFIYMMKQHFQDEASPAQQTAGTRFIDDLNQDIISSADSANNLLTHLRAQEPKLFDKLLDVMPDEARQIDAFWRLVRQVAGVTDDADLRDNGSVKKKLF